MFKVAFIHMFFRLEVFHSISITKYILNVVKLQKKSKIPNQCDAELFDLHSLASKIKLANNCHWDSFQRLSVYFFKQD